MGSDLGKIFNPFTGATVDDERGPGLCVDGSKASEHGEYQNSKRTIK